MKSSLPPFLGYRVSTWIAVTALLTLLLRHDAGAAEILYAGVAISVPHGRDTHFVRVDVGLLERGICRGTGGYCL
jgi:hypothetical protein